MMVPQCFVFFLLFASPAVAFAPIENRKGTNKALILKPDVFSAGRSPIDLDFVPSDESLDINVDGDDDVDDGKKSWMMAAGTTPVLLALFSSLPAEAAGGTSSFVLFSALAAYIHYASLLVNAICVTVHRVTIRPGMTQEENDLVTATNAVYTISALFLFGSGYYRVTQYGKGWDFYKYEPLFWLKIANFAILTAVSFFPTIMITQRAIEKRKDGSYSPMSEKLAKRLTSLVNTELLILLTIPLFATTMSRGILYTEMIPWQLEALFVPLAFFGLGYRYAKEALDWTEDETVVGEDS